MVEEEIKTMISKHHQFLNWKEVDSCSHTNKALWFHNPVDFGLPENTKILECICGMWFHDKKEMDK